MFLKIIKNLTAPILAVLSCFVPMLNASAADASLVFPPTGDETNVFLIIAILVAAAAVAVVLVILGKKNK